MISVYQLTQNPDTGSLLNISCAVTVPTGVDSSLVRISWIKDTTVTNTSQITVLDSYDGSRSVLTKTVLFRQLSAADGGTYRCNVTVNGFTTTSTEVIVVNGE